MKGYHYWPNNRRNKAVAIVKGGPLAPNIRGTVTFEDVPGGTKVCAAVYGLPLYQPAQDGQLPIGPHGFHLHENGSCAIGDPTSPYQAAGGHWNPTNDPHGHHAGDFPVLFSNNGYAQMCFFTDRFKVVDIVGKAVIIHEGPDDFQSQPSGNSGRRLACGVVQYARGY